METVDVVSWTKVSKKVKNTRKQQITTTSHPKGLIDQINSQQREKLLLTNYKIENDFSLDYINKTVNAMHSSKFYARVLRIITDVVAMQTMHSVFALGIGSFTKSSNSLIQFALFICLGRSLLGKDCENVDDVCPAMCIFDPTMSNIDAEICKEFHISVMKENLKGKHSVNDKTLFFMPHCPYRLYCNVLWQNWSSLHHLIILGNSFNSYSDRRIATQHADDATDTVRVLTPHVQEVNLWPPGAETADAKEAKRVHELSHLVNAFSDLSLMRFPTVSEEEAQLATPSCTGGGNALSSLLSAGRADEEAMDRAAELDPEVF